MKNKKRRIVDMEILIDNRTEEYILDDTTEKFIEKIAEITLEHLGKGKNYEISVSFVTNDEIKKLNRDYRNNDSVTDVLSFPMEEEFELDMENILLGDVVISVDKIKEQSIEYGHTFERELSYLFVHSLLHLFGFDHIEEKKKEVMRKEEKLIMEKLQIYKN
jgi:probable rRNA maturation factor